MITFREVTQVNSFERVFLSRDQAPLAHFSSAMAALAHVDMVDNIVHTHDDRFMLAVSAVRRSYAKLRHVLSAMKTSRWRSAAVAYSR